MPLSPESDSVGLVILLAEPEETLLAAKKKRQLESSPSLTSSPKNRVWGFEENRAGRPCSEPDLSWETAAGSVQFTYKNVSGRAGFISRDPLSGAEFSQGTNLYAYCGNDPVNLDDPTGQFINFLVGAAVGGLVDIGAQLIRNGGHLGSLNYTELGIATLAGAATSGISALAEGAGAAVVAKGGSALAGALTDAATNVVGNGALSAGTQIANNLNDGSSLLNGVGSSSLYGAGFGALGSSVDHIWSSVDSWTTLDNSSLLSDLFDSGALSGPPPTTSLSNIGTILGDTLGDLPTLFPSDNSSCP